MRKTARRIATAYLILGIWFGVMFATTLVTFALSHSIDLMDTADMPLIRTFGVMATGILTATVVVGLGWRRLLAGGHRETAAGAVGSELDEASHSATLMPIR